MARRLVERRPTLRRRRCSAGGDSRELVYSRQVCVRAGSKNFMKSILRRVIASTALNAGEAMTGGRAEWLVTNGLGGYASGTIYGQMTRRYHGLLIAALPAPLGRLVMLSGLVEEIQFANG